MAITRLDIVGGSGFALSKIYTNPETIRDNLVVYPQTEVRDMQTS